MVSIPMRAIRQQLFRTALASILFLSNATSSPSTTIAKVTLSDLFKQADLVATVRILSGDSEHYDVTVYKGQIEKAFKGARANQTIYFGPHVSFGVGSEYLGFLSKAEKGIEPGGKSPGVNYGVLPSFFRIMYAGFSIMPIEYVCVFDGKDTAQQCDYAVKLNPEQVIVPASVKAFPRGEAGPITNYEKWVRRDELVALLERFAK